MAGGHELRTENGEGKERREGVRREGEREGEEKIQLLGSQ